jgi:hypothetical protein
LGLRVEWQIVGKEFEIDLIGWLIETTVVKQSALIFIITGEKLALLGFFIGFW